MISKAISDAKHAGSQLLVGVEWLHAFKVDYILIIVESTSTSRHSDAIVTP